MQNMGNRTIGTGTVKPEAITNDQGMLSKTEPSTSSTVDAAAPSVKTKEDETLTATTEQSIKQVDATVGHPQAKPDKAVPGSPAQEKESKGSDKATETDATSSSGVKMAVSSSGAKTATSSSSDPKTGTTSDAKSDSSTSDTKYSLVATPTAPEEEEKSSKKSYVYTPTGALLDDSGKDITSIAARDDLSKNTNTVSTSVPVTAKSTKNTDRSDIGSQEAVTQAEAQITGPGKPEPTILELTSTESKTATEGLNKHFLEGKKDASPEVVPCFGKNGIDSAAQAINRQSGLSPSSGFDLDPNVQATAVAEEANAIREAEYAAAEAKVAEPEPADATPVEQPSSEPATVADAIMEEVEHLPGQWARGERDGLGEGPPVSMLKDGDGLVCISKLSYSACGERGCKWSKMSGMCTMPQGKVYSIIMNGQKTDGCACSDPKELVQSSTSGSGTSKTTLLTTSTGTSSMGLATDPQPSIVDGNEQVAAKTEAKSTAPTESQTKVLGILLQTEEGMQVSKVGSFMAWVGDRVKALASTLHVGLM